MQGKPGMGVGAGVSFIMGGWKIFKVSWSSWQRGANSTILWRPLFIAYPPPLQFFSNPPSPLTSLSPPTPTLTVFSAVLFLWLNGWPNQIWCAILFNDNMDLHMSSFGTLVPKGPWCVFYATRCQVYCSLTKCSFLPVLWLDSTHTHKHIQYIQGPVDWHTHIHIYLHHYLLCAHSSYFYYIKWLNE